jgi:hypothetical protein
VSALTKAINGVVMHTYVPRRKVAVQNDLREQGCYQLLLERAYIDKVISRIQ